MEENNPVVHELSIDIENENLAALHEFSVYIENMNPEMAEICKNTVKEYYRDNYEYIEENKYAIYRAAIDAYEIQYHGIADNIFQFVLENTNIERDIPHPSEI